MSIYLEEIINSPVLQQAKILNDQLVLENIKVSRVSVIEGPVENFIKENEFVLSSGIGCHDNTESLLNFANEVYQSGAAALAFATGGFYLIDIPKEIIEFANSKNFTIIEIPWEIRFADIIEEVNKMLHKSQQKELSIIKDFQKQLVEMFMSKKPYKDIIDFVELELNLSLLIVDRNGKYISGSADFNKIQSNFKLEFFNDFTYHDFYSSINKVKIDTATAYCSTISSKDQIHGYFFVLAPNSLSLTSEQLNIMEQTILISALWFSSQKEAEEPKFLKQNEYVINLAKHNNYNQVSKLEAQGYNFELSYECIVGYLEDSLSFFLKNKNNLDTKESWLVWLSSYIQNELDFISKSYGYKTIFAFDEGEILIFLEARESSLNSPINQILDLIERRLHSVAPGIIISWGIGKHEQGKMCFHESYKKASIAVDIGRKQKGKGMRIYYEDTKIDRLFIDLNNNPDIQTIISDTISSLVEYDERRGMELLHTFISYNENSRNVSQTARALNLHRQSLLYRLKKIESLTGLLLNESEDLFLLELSVRTWLKHTKQ
ncbi:PucR family transcriptional regulator ligand-binding domain-containing protein [Solibacillus sp. FSL R5-0449]|uniref:PucR family transcriptional regulator n=1 Tax=Solibacillus sp. FSL R5-0449 TaxID=2921639 RepID=UPI0030CF1E46